MRLRRAFGLSLRALFAHRLRTSLALASVGVGVASVLLTSALGQGAEREVRRGLAEAGQNLLVVRPAQVKRLASRRKVQGVVTTLRLEDDRAIAGLPLVAETAPGIDGGARVKAGGGSAVASLLGTSPSLFRLRNLRPGSGRLFDEEDDREARRVAVLGHRLAQTLFGDEDPRGREVRVRGVPFEVVGVLQPKGVGADGSDQDGTLFLPIRTALRRVFNVTWLTTVFVSVDERERMPEAERDVRDLLRERHRLAPAAPDDFDVQDQARILAMQRRAVRTLTLLTAGLAGVSMIVGGAGILALMLLSVKERTAEIGLRMAVGARPVDVLVQFLGEAALLSLGGWMAGAVVAVLAGLAVAKGTEWRVAVPAGAAFASLLMALATGLGFGALPARKAALVPPIRALASAS